MPMRNNASFIRPRLYDKDDPERSDDVELILDSLDEKLTRAMATGEQDEVEHITDLKRRVLNSAGEGYKEHIESDDEPEDKNGS